MNLAEYLRGQSRRAPEAEAVVCGAERLTFGELDLAVDSMASGLDSLGVRQGHRVAICLPNGIDFVLVFLAACRIGAVTVPVNVKLADVEIAYIIADSSPVVLAITDDRWQSLSGHVSAEVVPVVTDADGANAGSVNGGHRGEDQSSRVQLLRDLASSEPCALPERSLATEDCAICYTSGTTGHPKGAVLTHANYIVAHGYLNSVAWGMGPSDRTLITTPMAHRTGLARIVNTVCNGSAVVIMPAFEVDEVLRAIEVERITVLGMVPTVGRMLIDAIEAQPERFSSLRAVVGTGEAFPVELAERFEATVPGLTVFAFFAMTEVGQIAALHPAERRGHEGSVGRPVLGSELKLVNDEGKEVSLGEAGEILVRSGSPGQNLVMREYHNMPEATAAVLHDGWFATGDLGRFDQDGFLYIVDRKKDMIVSGGYNVYSREVEDAVRQHPEVADVAVVGVPDDRYGESVAAFIERNPGAALSEADVIEHCRSCIAGYKKPRTVVFVERLPRSATGKVLKRQLRSMDSSLPDTEVHDRA